jgi:Predicted phosphoglycerate mutase, AP superfamily
LRPYEAVLEENYVVVTSDHATPISVREHTGEPVPILLYGPDVVRDDVDKFSELTCWHGALGRIRGMDVMPTIASYLGLSEKIRRVRTSSVAPGRRPRPARLGVLLGVRAAGAHAY